MSDLRTAVTTTADAAQRLAADLPDLLERRGWTVGTAESLTGGTIASVLAAAPSAQEWLRGAVVAYTPQVKFDLLGVPEGPVVTEECARTMATSTARLLGADLVVAVTGVGGPEPDEGQPAGTVWFAVATPDGVRAEKKVFGGDAPDVLTATTEHAMAMLRDTARCD
ncbi:CinA family protein [Actinotalea sp. Marseille-Q4924]|uniref:CinA family protein n=1 Tax=Actinotalea sp. Marseille-Q4924 TaxID=2866571 RepID=UPI001CE451B7|nr:CinA family protein [Actinotalea sp. Marseille-Q4924]